MSRGGRRCRNATDAWRSLARTQAMDRLLLNDASVVVRRENSEALGPGFRCARLPGVAGSARLGASGGAAVAV